MSNMLTDTDDIQVIEPILAQKNVSVEIVKVEKAQWEAKTGGVKNGQFFDALKVSILIKDVSVKTEHEGAKPRLSVEDQFNIVSFPYEDKKTGEIKKLGREKLYQLEAAFGFDPVFVLNGSQVEPYITKNGNKVAPKTEGVKRSINPDFFDAYFNADNSPKIENWIGKKLCADIGVENNEQYGAKNVVKRYIKPQAI